MRKIIKNDSGFTLIEAIIALGVLSIGILAMFSMQSLGIKGNANASRISTQASWGSDGIEQVLPSKYVDIIDKVSTPIPADAKYTVQTSTTVDIPMNHIKTVVITVTNVADGKQVAMRYLKADESSF